MQNDLTIIGTVHEDLDGASRLERVFREIKPAAICVESDKETIRMYKEGMILDADSDFSTAEQELDSLVQEMQTDSFKDESIELMKGLVHAIFSKTLDGRSFLAAAYYLAAMSINLGFEYKISKRYVEQNGILLRCVDLKPEPLKHPERINVSPRIMSLAQEEPEVMNEYLEAFSKGPLACLKMQRKITHELYAKSDFKTIFKEARDDLAKGTFDNDSVSKHIYDHEREDHMAKMISETMQRTSGSTIVVVGLGHLDGLHERLKDYVPQLRRLDFFC